MIYKEEYNYRAFKAKYYDMADFTGPKAGEIAPDFEAILVDGTKTKLSNYLSKPVILELGSYTCPLFCQYLKRMNTLVKEYPNFNFLVLYVREAHPGERCHNHSTISDKIIAAKKLIKDEKEMRTILIDDIEGTTHKQYGGLPNSCFVINPNGEMLYASDSTNNKLLEIFLKNYDGKTLEKQLNYDRFLDDPSIFQALKVLFRGGIKAIFDFIFQLPKVFAIHRKWNASFGNNSSTK